MLNTDLLNINPDTVCFIIAKAKELHAKEGVTFEEKIDDSAYEYDWAQILADHKDDLTYTEVRNIIEELDTDQKVDLLALMYLGRGDFEDNEWNAARAEAKNNLLPNLTDYLLEKPFLADYLQRALEVLGSSCE